MGDDASAAGGPASFDADAWAAQSLWWSERQRSRPLIWPAGASWFSNDPLGPDQFCHVMSGTPHSVRNTGGQPLRLLSIWAADPAAGSEQPDG